MTKTYNVTIEVYTNDGEDDEEAYYKFESGLDTLGTVINIEEAS